MLGTMEVMQPGSLVRVIVGDNGLSPAYRASLIARGVTIVDVPADPFIYAQAINLMVAATLPGQDIVILEDDMEMRTPSWLARIEELLTKWPDGYCVLQLAGSPNQWQMKSDDVVLSETTVGLGISIIPRTVWDVVGPMDERYVGYGWEDTDWCVRALHAGYTIGITGAVQVEHLKGQQGYIRRAGNYGKVIDKCKTSQALFAEKWGKDIGEIKFEPLAPHFDRRCGCKGI